MRFPEFITTIIESDAEDWHTDRVGGPYFRYQLGPVEQNGQLKTLEYEAHEKRAIYKGDIDISMEWGYRYLDDFKEEWANSFADRTASASFLDLKYRGDIIHREIIVSVDGGRCYLPLPLVPAEGAKNIQVPRGRVKLVRLVQEITGTWEFDEYFRRSGLEVVETDWP